MDRRKTGYMQNLSAYYKFDGRAKKSKLDFTSDGGGRREEKSRKLWSFFTKLLS